MNRWQRLLPAGTELKEVNAIHAVKTGKHPLLDGVSATDVWWSDIQPWGLAEQGEVQVAYSVKAGDTASELIAPGALVVINVEGGLLLIDQLLWENKGVHRQRSGIYLSLLLENLRSTRAH